MVQYQGDEGESAFSKKFTESSTFDKGANVGIKTTKPFRFRHLKGNP